MWQTFLKYLLLLAGAAPLIIYPAAMIASVMGLAAHVSASTPIWQVWLANGFHIAVLLYPAVYLVMAIFAAQAKSISALYWAAGPLLYLVVLGLFILAM